MARLAGAKLAAAAAVAGAVVGAVVGAVMGAVAGAVVGAAVGAAEGLEASAGCENQSSSSDMSDSPTVSTACCAFLGAAGLGADFPSGGPASDRVCIYK